MRRSIIGLIVVAAVGAGAAAYYMRDGETVEGAANAPQGGNSGRGGGGNFGGGGASADRADLAGPGSAAARARR